MFGETSANSISSSMVLLVRRVLLGVASSNDTVCPLNCSHPNGKCINGTCSCEVQFSGVSCSEPNESYLTVFATLSYLLFTIATVQLILCMISDSQSDQANSTADMRWKKAFRTTVQKSLLGTVIFATGTRAIYFTVQNFGISERWADVLHVIYYPALLTAFSILICYWAEVFYQSDVDRAMGFLRKQKYFVGCAIFNGLVYLLLLGDVIATPLISDAELAHKSFVIGVIFVALLLLMLIGFLHYGVRLFFRPDWRPLSSVFNINMKQQVHSILGVLTNALMQSLIIVMLMVDLLGRMLDIDSHSLSTMLMVVHVIELALPVWFSCSLWNFKRPTSLWILNPGLLLRTQPKYDDLAKESETDSLVSTERKSYGTTEGNKRVNESAPDCWICLQSGDVNDLFKPCRCSAVHKSCLYTWLTERSQRNSTRETLQCQVCTEKYKVMKKRRWIPTGLKKKHWAIAISIVVAITVVTSLASTAYWVSTTMGKVALICVVVAIDAVLLKLLGFGIVSAYKRSKLSKLIVIGEPVLFDAASLTASIGSTTSSTSSGPELEISQQSVFIEPIIVS